jgi:predicted glycosyltransferase
MRVWIDLANSPHPLLFAPIARRLRERGDEVAITARDHAQTLQLARAYFDEVDVVGEASPDGRLAKARSVGGRVAALWRWGRGRNLDVALSHNSYAQLLAARALRLPTVTAMDFEHQPANHLAFRAARTILLPEALPGDLVRRQGAKAPKVVRYAGFKEELYLADFDFDEGILARLGIEREPGTAVVVARSAPAGAAYHPDENPLFVEGLRVLSAQSHVRCVVLARHAHQRAEIESMNLPNCHIPATAIDSRSLLNAADLFVGAGGTMTREAALLGLPTLSLFAGERAAVDAALERQGRLRTLTGLDQLADVEPRDPAATGADLESLRDAAARIGSAFVEATLTAAEAKR